MHIRATQMPHQMPCPTVDQSLLLFRAPLPSAVVLLVLVVVVVIIIIAPVVVTVVVIGHEIRDERCVKLRRGAFLPLLPLLPPRGFGSPSPRSRLVGCLPIRHSCLSEEESGLGRAGHGAGWGMGRAAWWMRAGGTPHVAGTGGIVGTALPHAPCPTHGYTHRGHCTALGIESRASTRSMAVGGRPSLCTEHRAQDQARAS